MTDLFRLLAQQFPEAQFDVGNYALGLGAWPQWDSLGHFNFLLLVEQHFNVRFEPDELAAMKSLSDLQTALRKRGIEA